VQSAVLRSPSSPRDGFVVIAALWMLVALATLATVYSAYVAQSAVELRVPDDAIESESSIRASLQLTAYQLSPAKIEHRPTRGAFGFRLAHADLAVEFVSEAARIDLNAAPSTLIAGLFAVLGAPPQTAENYAERVLGWRAPAKDNLPSSEDALYRTAGLAYGPRRSPFRHVDELWLVLGLPPVLVERALPFLTVYSGLGEVNVLDAAPKVIAALPGMSPPRLKAFLSERERFPADPQFVAGALGGNVSGATTKGSDAYRVRTQMRYREGRQKQSEVVIMMMPGSGAEPYRVLSWRDIDPDTRGGG
jgi:general secretion pathway protein K